MALIRQFLQDLNSTSKEHRVRKVEGLHVQKWGDTEFWMFWVLFFNHPTFGVHNFGPFPMCAWVTAFEIVNGQQQFHSTRVPDKKLSRIRRNDPTHEHVQETGDQNQHMFTRWQCSTTLKNMFPDYQHCLGRPRKPPTVGLAHHFHPFPPSKFWSTSEIFPRFFPTDFHYPLVNIQKTIENGTVEIVSFPTKQWWIFP